METKPWRGPEKPSCYSTHFCINSSKFWKSRIFQPPPDFLFRILSNCTRAGFGDLVKFVLMQLLVLFFWNISFLSCQNCSGQIKKAQIRCLLLPQVCIGEVAGKKSQESMSWAVAIVTIAVLQLLPTPVIVNCHSVKTVCLPDLVSQELPGWQLWWQFITYCGFCLGEWDWSAIGKLAASTMYLSNQISSRSVF